MLDEETNAKHFKNALEAVESFNNENSHDGIYVLIEPKGFYDPFKNISPFEFTRRIEKAIKDVFFTSEIVCPNDVLTEKSRKDNRRNFLLRGKNRVCFVLIDSFLARWGYEKSRLEDMHSVLFTINNKKDETCIFYNQNSPYKKRDWINHLVHDGFIVRTRSDLKGMRNQEVAKDAITSNAQIISTDFPMDFLNKTNKEIDEKLMEYDYLEFMESDKGLW